MAETGLRRRTVPDAKRFALPDGAGDQPPVPRLDEPDGRVTFSELVWLHWSWQREVQEGSPGEADAKATYLKALKRFEDEHGVIDDAYWCSNPPSAVALTRKTEGIGRRERFRFHRETDWATKDKPAIAALLHKCAALAIRVAEVLKPKTHRICMQLVMASAKHALALADEKSGHANDADEQQAIADEAAALARTEHYYEAVALREAQIEYFWGMATGLGVLIGIVVLATASSRFELGDTSIVCLVAGAVGALISVMARMTSGRFSIDFELGRGSLRAFASFRPFLGAAFGLVLYGALASDVVNLDIAADVTLPFYALIAFAAGFSERFAKDVLDAAEQTVSAAARAATPTTTQGGSGV